MVEVNLESLGWIVRKLALVQEDARGLSEAIDEIAMATGDAVGRTCALCGQLIRPREGSSWWMQLPVHRSCGDLDRIASDAAVSMPDAAYELVANRAGEVVV